MAHIDRMTAAPVGGATGPLTGGITPSGNQSGLRDRNARAVLSYIRRSGGLPSADIARQSGLSAQTVSNIIRALETDGLILRGAAIKGKVGKPSVPVRLNPQGAHGLGLNIGRRSAELVLVDFCGAPLESLSAAYPYPTIDHVFGFLQQGQAQIQAKHPHARITGIGVARPSRIWDWLELVDAPDEAMRRWRDLDIAARVTHQTGLEVLVENDATSACVAEHLLGRGKAYANFVYMFLGAFIGGGLVLNGQVVSGRTGHAASLGPMPMPDGSGGTTELLNLTSLHVLESLLVRDGLNPMDLRRSPEDWQFCETQVQEWIAQTSGPLALAAASVTSILEVEAILIDGAMPTEVCTRLTQAIGHAFDALNLTMMAKPGIEQAQVGKRARALGAALLPLHARYFLA
ncbi:MAG: ROK family transcriptional regulator [Primorskyibacter sp.]